VWQGLNPAHRAVFMTGIMTYVSAPLWLLSLALSTTFIVLQTVIGPQYFVHPRQLFPIWPEWDVHSAIGFAVGTGVVLFLPKVLGAILVVARGADRFGGVLRLTLSVFLELVFSALLAPVRMLFHTQFVVAALTGLHVRWSSPPREDTQTTWGEAMRHHGVHTLIGIAWGAGIYWIHPPYTWWLLPVVGALALSMPMSVYSSRVSLGRAMRRVKLFLIPEETDPPHELRTMRAHAGRAGEAPHFVDAVVDPTVNAIAISFAASSSGARRSAGMQSRCDRIIAMAVEQGPSALTDGQKLFFLTDPIALSRLHAQVSTSPAAHPSWRLARVADGLGHGAALGHAS
jgi:membrane glycosyltransferase